MQTLTSFAYTKNIHLSVSPTSQMVKICKLHINTVTFKLMNKFKVLISFDLHKF